MLRQPAAAAAEQAALASSFGPLTSRNGGYRVTLEPVRKPVEIGVTGPWLATLRNGEGKLVPGCSLALEGWMPAHGHGLPTAPRMTREIEPGVYWFEGVRLSMPGAWELTIAIQGCGASDAVRFPLEL